MKKKIVWLVVTCWMVAALLLASCAPAVVKEEEEKVAPPKEKEEVVVPKEEEVVVPEKEVGMVRDVLGRLVPKPQYGGWLTLVKEADPAAGWSRTTLFGAAHGWHSFVTQETLLYNDRLKGPAGTVEWTGLYGIFIGHLVTGHLAESWEIVEPDTIIMHIRKGIYWQNKPPVNGVEFTPEDVVYSFVLGYSMPGSTWPKGYPYISDTKNPENSIYIHPDDPRAVVFKAAPGHLSTLFERIAAVWMIMSKELGDPKGTGPDTWTWKSYVGTGAMMLEDVVHGSAYTWERNPNYWQKDVFHPENQLPYLDGLRVLIVPDISSRQAALRTGKVDVIVEVQEEEQQSLLRSNPELLSMSALGSLDSVSMRLDKAPYDNVNVRRAMMMAINFDEIVDDYYEGNAYKFWWPAFPVPEHKDMYVPLEEMPESVQELYGYHPDKARQLLAEAGYPDGFATEVIIASSDLPGIDVLQIIAEYWSKVGITLKIDIKESAIVTAMGRARTVPHGIYYANFLSAPMKFTRARVGGSYNFGNVNDPLVEATMRANAAAGYLNWDEVSRITKEALPEIQNHAILIFMPIPKVYSMWQPWLKAYYGEIDTYRRSETEGVARWVWIDQELKKAMGH